MAWAGASYWLPEIVARPSHPHPAGWWVGGHVGVTEIVARPSHPHPADVWVGLHSLVLFDCLFSGVFQWL